MERLSVPPSGVWHKRACLLTFHPPTPIHNTNPRTQGEEQISWDLVGAAAAERIARHTRPGKGRLVLAGTERLPARKQVGGGVRGMWCGGWGGAGWWG